MQTYKITRTPRHTLKRALSSKISSPARKMSFFPHSFLSRPSSHSPLGFDNNTSSSSFHPLFRLLDDFDNYNRSASPSNTNNTGRHHQTMKSFTPRFDVKETADAYELHGELPGIEQKDIEIEFVDAETLTIKGRVERSYTSGTTPNDATATKAIEGAQDNQATIKDKAHQHQPTVEDESDAVARVTTDGNNGNNGNNESGTLATTKDGEKSVAKAEEPKERFWVSERSVGEFSRSFTFPVRVEQDAVKASMRNGVLSVVVPKGKKVEGRKIRIE